MYLLKLIKVLETIPEHVVFKEGFVNPHSYRGNYDDLAVEPMSNVKVVDMVSCLEQAVGSTYRGYKGGHFDMVGTEDVYLAYKGCTGSKIIGYKVTDEGYSLCTEEW